MKSQLVDHMAVEMTCKKTVCKVERSRVHMTSTISASVEDSHCKQVKTKAAIGEALKRKLSIGASSVFQLGGSKRVFKQVFGCREGEKIGKVFRCFLSTTAGPIQGMVFVSNQNLSFCSSKLIKIPSASGKGEVIRIRYKVTIPLQRITTINVRTSDEKPLEKYIQVETSDNFDFWFMGFFNHHKAYKYLHRSIPNDSLNDNQHL